MNRHIELALRTWYPKDHELHKAANPAVLGLIGEAGEIAELVKKAIYKYKKPIDRDLLLAECGDYWYYLRILVYQNGASIGECLNIVKSRYYVSPGGENLEVLTISLSNDSTRIVMNERYEAVNRQLEFVDAIETLLRIIKMFNCTLDQLTDLNYAKLSGGKHGWPEHGKEEQKAIITGSEIDFSLEVPLSELQEKAQDIWSNPEKYYVFADVWYNFVGLLWVKYPNGTEKRLADIVKEQENVK